MSPTPSVLPLSTIAENHHMESRLKAELRVRQSLDKKFFNTKSIMRRDPERYMRNPTKVFCSTHFNNKFTLYDMPGYHKTSISKNKSPLRQSLPLDIDRGTSSSPPPSELKSLVVPRVPQFTSKMTVKPKTFMTASLDSGTYFPRSTFSKQDKFKDAFPKEYLLSHREPTYNRQVDYFKGD